MGSVSDTSTDHNNKQFKMMREQYKHTHTLTHKLAAVATPPPNTATEETQWKWKELEGCLPK